MQKSNGAEASG
jgi:pilus assembly protein Flp/PilA